MWVWPYPWGVIVLVSAPKQLIVNLFPIRKLAAFTLHCSDAHLDGEYRWEGSARRAPEGH